MKQIEVFDGSELHKLPVNYPIGQAVCAFQGTDENGRDIASSILVLASEDLYNEAYVSSSGYANHDAITSVINTMVGRTEQAYTVDDKKITASTFTPTEIQSNIIKYVCVGVIPIGLLVVGIVIVIRRKRK